MQEEVLSGTVERLLYQDKANGFTIFVLRTKSADITIKGYLPDLTQGQEVDVHGSWIFHPKFGKQFQATSCSTRLPTSLNGLKKYLSSGLIKGIGKTYGEKLVDHFGTTVLEIIDQQPERLSEVPGIGPKRIETIQEAWKDQKSIADIMVFLQDKGISTTYATKIYKRYGHESIAILHDNPYRIADDIWGIGFKMADTIAQNIGFAKTSKQRLTAGILFALTSAMSSGHLYVELECLRQQTCELLELAAEDKSLLKGSFHDLYNKEKIQLLTQETTHYIALAKSYYCEKGLTKNLQTLLTQSSRHVFPIQEIYQNLRTGLSGITLNEKQQHGILTTLQNKVTIITGGPGTGKTTLIKQLLHTLDNHNASYKLSAPTGRAAKRITEGTGKFATTIHRLLEFDVGAMRFSRNEHNALKLDFLIVDEASMIDIFLAHSLVRALPLTAHLVLIGDIDQLPSVGPGNVLKDCIASNVIPCVHLTEIFRQAQDSQIIVNAHRVNNGEFPTTSLPGTRKDFMYIKEKEPENLVKHIKRVLFSELIKKKISPQECQILTPMNRGAAGTQNLNHFVQKLLNPDAGPHLTYSGFTYKKNDRVMQTRNNYDKDIFNGDIGTVTHVDSENKKLTISCHNREIEYDISELSELVLAYAISIHKSQGSEYPAVIIPLFTQHFTLLQRNLLYTAITRAKKFCCIIGDPRAIGIAVSNNKTINRTTFLAHFLAHQEV